jgi:Domain of unknown function (DUF4268)
MTSEPTAKPNLGRLEKIDLATYWQTEASDFIPWLIQDENLKLLGDTIGLELEVVLDAAQVEELQSDLLCREVKTGEWVLIGNQLTPSDEKHLGRLLTYAADIDASAVVWISSQFSPEHRTTLTWLNRITQSKIQFFGLEIELWRIGEAAMAARFNLVTPVKAATSTTQPQAEPKTITEVTQPEEIPEEISEPAPEPLSEIQLQNLDFWTALCNKLERRGSIVKPGAPVTEDRINFAIGRAGFRLYASLDREASCLDAGLSYSGVDTQAYFHLLLQQQDAIEADLGIPIDWSNDSDGQTFAAYASHHEIDLEDGDRWPAYIEAACNDLEQFHGTFCERIKMLSAGNFRPMPYSLNPLQNALILPS